MRKYNKVFGVNFFRAEVDLTTDEMRVEYVKINKDYEQSLADMLGIITILNKTHSSPYLYQLLLKLDYRGTA